MCGAVRVYSDDELLSVICKENYLYKPQKKPFFFIYYINHHPNLYICS